MDIAEEREIKAGARDSFRTFLVDKYGEQINSMVAKDRTRLIVDFPDLRESYPELSRRILDNPALYMEALSEGLNDAVLHFSGMKKQQSSTYNVGFVGTVRSRNLSPRSLNSTFLHSLVQVAGIVTKVSLCHANVAESVHYCPATDKFITKHYPISEYSLKGGGAGGGVYPTKDEDGNLLETEVGLSEYRDSQTVFVQEFHEDAPTGQLPHSVQISVGDDLVDICKPGDRVTICGMYATSPRRNATASSGVFKTRIVANSIDVSRSNAIDSELDKKDKKTITDLKDKHGDDIVSLLGQSIAPSIYGHGDIKLAILLLLLGGVEKSMPEGHHLRGDINLLMVGDPSTAKSQLLRFVLNIAPLAINTTGRGSSGVGLTAAVTVDPETHERALEAGAMVLADRGVVCIDEFDKMSEDDRVAIHEVMEQQTVTIAKAGIHASLNARCSVVAAANPAYGQYKKNKKASDNIRLPDSLLSRFDLLFIVLDEPNANRDRSIAEHVLQLHRLLFNQKRSSGKDTLSFDIIRKYIAYAKQVYKPKLTDEANQAMRENYVKLRKRMNDVEGKADSVPVTTRTLETLIRLSSAHAKARLSDVVETSDAKAAFNLIAHAMFQSAVPGAAGVNDEDEDDDENDENGNFNIGEGDLEGNSPKRPKSERIKKKRGRLSPSRSRRRTKSRLDDDDTDDGADADADGVAKADDMDLDDDGDGRGDDSEDSPPNPSSAPSRQVEEQLAEIEEEEELSRMLTAFVYKRKSIVSQDPKATQVEISVEETADHLGVTSSVVESLVDDLSSSVNLEIIGDTKSGKKIIFQL